MKETETHYTDKNNNSWDKENYTEIQAAKLSETLLNCSYCRDCSYCSYCRNFKTNPQRYTTDFIGSRESQTTFYWNKEINQVICGCFTDNLLAFEKQVIKTHNNSEHGLKYLSEIKKVKILMGDN